MWKTKAHLKLKLVRDMKDKNNFSSKRNAGEILGLVLSADEDLVIKDTEEAETLFCFCFWFCLTFFSLARSPLWLPGSHYLLAEPVKMQRKLQLRSA